MKLLRSSDFLFAAFPPLICIPPFGILIRTFPSSLLEIQTPVREGYHLCSSVVPPAMCAAVSIKPEVCGALAGRLRLMGLHAKRPSIIELMMRRTCRKGSLITAISFAVNSRSLSRKSETLGTKLDGKKSLGCKAHLMLRRIFQEILVLSGLSAIRATGVCSGEEGVCVCGGGCLGVTARTRRWMKRKKGADGRRKVCLLLGAAGTRRREEERQNGAGEGVGRCSDPQRSTVGGGRGSSAGSRRPEVVGRRS